MSDLPISLGVWSGSRALHLAACQETASLRSQWDVFVVVIVDLGTSWLWPVA